MGKEELKLINWDVLWLVAGGIAIGLAIDKTGLTLRCLMPWITMPYHHSPWCERSL
ncbi:hypothetical protein GMA8713_03388 [Grimontia marina]|uniref:Uncharacterized protein n=1 Tax=Grimontia marina TaxID=646534 RepID=A0A128FE79_9GAMM|nr:hypothetical protein GMA8713_03388 [Grimontia marina]